MKLKKTTQGNQEIIILINDQGVECTCPFKQPVPVQTQFGQNSLFELPCTSKCALFSIIDNNFCCNAGKNNQNRLITGVIDDNLINKLTDL